MLSPTQSEELKRITALSEDMKFKLLAQGTVATLHAVNLLGPQASASQIVLMLTMAKGKMISLTQIAPVLKDLIQWNCLSIKDITSDYTGRSVHVYTLTKKGEHILQLCVQLIDTMMKKK
jgi:predicted transcriptional regulator